MARFDVRAAINRLSAHAGLISIYAIWAVSYEQYPPAVPDIEYIELACESGGIQLPSAAYSRPKPAHAGRFPSASIMHGTLSFQCLFQCSLHPPYLLFLHGRPEAATTYQRLNSRLAFRHKTDSIARHDHGRS